MSRARDSTPHHSSVPYVEVPAAVTEEEVLECQAKWASAIKTTSKTCLDKGGSVAAAGEAAGELYPRGRVGAAAPAGAARLAGLAARALPPAEAAALVAAVYEHGLLVVPGQGGMSPADEVALARLFPFDADEDHASGSYTGGASKQHKLPGQPEVALVGSFDLKDYHGFTGGSSGVYNGWGPDDRAWHNDGFADTLPPPDVTVMRCVLTPAEGGETLFASSVAGAEGLPALVGGVDPERVRLRYRLFEKSLRKPNGLRLLPGSEGKKGDDVNVKAGERDVCHPLVAREPRSGSRTLVGTYHVASGYVVKADGSGAVERELGFEEANALAEACWAPAVAPEKVYAHRWAPGDVVIWSNRLVTHTATATSRYEKGANRLMHRVRLRAPPVEGLQPWRP